MGDNHIIMAGYDPRTLRYRTRDAYQYDYGQMLNLSGFGDALPETFEVHFSGVLANGDAVTMIGQNGMVRIPDQCLTRAVTVTAWLYLHDTETDGETRYTIEIPVKPRAGISKVSPQPEEQSVITQAIAALNTGVSRATEAKTDAETARQGAETALRKIEQKGRRVRSMDTTPLLMDNVIEAIGAPVYVNDPSAYTEYGLTETGWYLFAEIGPEAGILTGEIAVTGADGSVLSENGVRVAVRFNVAAESRTVTVQWNEDVTETFVFRATDLAIRNLDYRVTFYLYDAAPFVTWEYQRSMDATFQNGKAYYISDGEGGYEKANVSIYRYLPTEDATFHGSKTYYISDGEGGYTAAEVSLTAYVLTEDETFQNGKTYYVSDGEGGYTAAQVTEGESVTASTYYEQTANPVPANTYYEQSANPMPLYYEQVGEFALTSDATFVEGVTYYTIVDDVPTEATVTTGETVPANTYYVLVYSYVLTTDEAFVDGKTYYTSENNAYGIATVTPGDPITPYYVHSKGIFSGMSRNITYQLDEMIDCPVEIVCPEIPEDGYGAWFELQTRMDGAYSVTLTLPEGVTAGTTNTQAFAAGLNVIDLHYVSVAGAKTWQLINTCTKLS